MARFKQHRSIQRQNESKADMTPMLDIVFILLLFFIVTTSFVTTDTVNISQPSSVCEQDCDSDATPLIVTIDAQNQVSIDQRIIDIEAVQANIEGKLIDDINTAVIVKVHNDAYNASMISAIDQANKAGVSNVSVAKWQ